MSDLQKKTTDMGWPESQALWLYTPLPEPQLSSELARLSFAQSLPDTDVISFQPCPNPEHASQDRFVIKDWPLSNGTWSFRAIFDGHAGHDTADYSVSNLPDLVKNQLADLLDQHHSPSPALIADMLSNSISSFDKAIGQALLDLFPDPDALADMPVEDVQRIINDDGPNSDIVIRCMRGTTALISLVDPSKANIWVASLGDCAAILGTKHESEWKATVLSSSHNGENQTEVDKVRREHPGEPECVMDDRVLGAIAVTRAIGDFTFKLPAIYAKRVFMNSRPGFLLAEKVRNFIGRNLTPPYMSGVPDIRHVDLTTLSSKETFLIMCSDGMMDLCDDDRLKLEEILAPEWVKLVGEHYTDGKTNLALRLLREGLGGEDEEKVSRMITVEMSFRWMDDTTVLVHRLY